MKRSKLIGLDSPLYMKRVVREVRKMIISKRSVYVVVDGHRLAVLEVEIFKFAIRARVDCPSKKRVWVNVNTIGFRDDNDQEITASRTERN